MKARIPLLTAALVIAGAAALLLARRPPAPALPATVAVPGQSGAASGAGARANAALVAAAARAREPSPSVKLAAGQSVATVNGTAITGRHLLAYRARDPALLEMTAAMYASLRNRAIERELTFQEARTRGIELAPAEREQLKAVRKNAEARGETDPAQLDFEEADARAHLLAATLLRQRGVHDPFATEADVRAYYENHPGEFDPLPQDPAAREAAWKRAAIEIRQTLSIDLQEQHQQRVREYFDQLRAAARITD